MGTTNAITRSGIRVTR